jgi:hypothetical protein
VRRVFVEHVERVAQRRFFLIALALFDEAVVVLDAGLRRVAHLRIRDGFDFLELLLQRAAGADDRVGLLLRLRARRAFVERLLDARLLVPVDLLARLLEIHAGRARLVRREHLLNDADVRLRARRVDLLLHLFGSEPEPRRVGRDGVDLVLQLEPHPPRIHRIRDREVARILEGRFELLPFVALHLAVDVAAQREIDVVGVLGADFLEREALSRRAEAGGDFIGERVEVGADALRQSEAIRPVLRERAGFRVVEQRVFALRGLRRRVQNRDLVGAVLLLGNDVRAHLGGLRADALEHLALLPLRFDERRAERGRGRRRGLAHARDRRELFLLLAVERDRRHLRGLSRGAEPVFVQQQIAAASRDRADRGDRAVRVRLLPGFRFVEPGVTRDLRALSEVRALHLIAPRFARGVGANRERVELAEERGILLHVDRRAEADVDVAGRFAGALRRNHALDLRPEPVLRDLAALERVARLQVRHARVEVGEVRLRVRRFLLCGAELLGGLALFLLPIGLQADAGGREPERERSEERHRYPLSPLP